MGGGFSLNPGGASSPRGDACPPDCGEIRMNNMIYFNCCASWDPKDVHADGGLCDMIDEAITLTRRTFLAHVDRKGLAKVEAMLGYATHPSQGMTMAGDYHVSYHRSKLHGERVYFFKHSAIEYVFVDPDSPMVGDLDDDYQQAA